MITLLLSLALSAASMAEPAASTGASQSAKPVKPKKVCEKIEVTGSTVPKRVCRTVVEPAPTAEAARTDAVQPSGGSTN